MLQISTQGVDKDKSEEKKSFKLICNHLNERYQLCGKSKLYKMTLPNYVREN